MKKRAEMDKKALIIDDTVESTNDDHFFIEKSQSTDQNQIPNENSKLVKGVSTLKRLSKTPNMTPLIEIEFNVNQNIVHKN